MQSKLAFFVLSQIFLCVSVFRWCSIVKFVRCWHTNTNNKMVKKIVCTAKHIPLSQSLNNIIVTDVMTCPVKVAVKNYLVNNSRILLFWTLRNSLLLLRVDSCLLSPQLSNSTIWPTNILTEKLFLPPYILKMFAVDFLRFFFSTNPTEIPQKTLIVVTYADLCWWHLK